MNARPRYFVWPALIGLALTISVCNFSVPLTPRPAAPAGAQSAGPRAATWYPAGFGGAGNFDGIFFDPGQPGVVYAASDVSGVFRSVDAGEHWEMRSVGLGNFEVSSFAVDP